MILIYQIKNNINNKIYVGQTTRHLKQRFAEHKRSKSDCKHLKRAMDKYGVDNFYIEIITVCHTQECANILEDYFIKHFNSIENGYNIREGGSRGKFTAETRKRMSLARKGIVFSPEHKRKLSEAGKGKTFQHTDEAKRKISLSQIGRTSPNKGKTLSEEQRGKISKAKSGIKFSEEHKENLSKSLMGRKLNEETKRKMSASKIGKTHKDNKFNFTREKLESAISNNNTVRKIILSLGLRASSRNYKKFHEEIKRLGLDLTSVNKDIRLK